MKKQEKMFKIAFYEGTDFKIARKNTVIFLHLLPKHPFNTEI